MKLEARLFGLLTPFFLIVSAGYGIWSKGELVGTLALLLVGGLVGMIGLYLSLVARRIDARPEDDPYGEIAQGAGEQGVYSPGSWWPLACAATVPAVPDADRARPTPTVRASATFRRDLLVRRAHPDETWVRRRRQDQPSLQAACSGGDDQPRRLGPGPAEALGGVGPVDDVPPRLDVVRLDVDVVQVERVLPHVQQHDRHDAERQVALVVVQLEHDQLLADGVPCEDRPAGPLDAYGGGREVLLELSLIHISEPTRP